MNFFDETILISIDSLLEEKMRIVNGEKILLDFELAELLQVSTKDLISKVRANVERFPNDFLIKIPAMQYIRSLPPFEKRRRVLYGFNLGGIMMAAGRFHTPRANEISIKIVDFVCRRTGGMERVLEMVQKAIQKDS